MKAPSSLMSPLLQVRTAHFSSNANANASRQMQKQKAAHDFDTSCCSHKTFDADISYRSGCPADRLIKGCLKVQTQRDSLSRISNRTNTSVGSSQLFELDPIREQTHVRFDIVEFREYPRALSDNPSTSSGPPIGIGWRYDPNDTIVLDLDSYECDRVDNRRTKRELAIPANIREDMLREAGYSRNEITKVVRQARKDKERRHVSFHQQKFDPILERVEIVKHGVRRIIPRGAMMC
mmetsp:Transcript_34497/g.83484  ORF Transcript_34497/g.83484 Transcript_34497/m.83484 type:complete len:236 (+) Transcript_34497:38-745(+)|eukprot:CAMPEP_0181097650 /NCGR_PEP_ID=MMETSP1071-20121207/11685_1 /TAXON_ID=35127 /ORGANISM="Thalassiosira sp., Strain NH16" /LENGTH=235 /DNA_ID=CAMNT_0023180151 /DNA_START=6 /DNA_END=713 /DNA_ORIENTATION=-